MALNPDQQARLNAGAMVASGLAASPEWWKSVNARKRRNPQTVVTYSEILAEEAMSVVDVIEAIVTA